MVLNLRWELQLEVWASPVVPGWEAMPLLASCWTPPTTGNNFACMGGVAGPLGTNTCVGPGPYAMGQANVMAVYPTMAACQADPKLWWR